MAHIYHCHFREVALLGLHVHLNCVFAHLTLLNQRFNLIDPKETEILGDLEAALLGQYIHNNLMTARSFLIPKNNFLIFYFFPNRWFILRFLPHTRSHGNVDVNDCDISGDLDDGNLGFFETGRNVGVRSSLTQKINLLIFLCSAIRDKKSEEKLMKKSFCIISWKITEFNYKLS